MYKLCSSCAQWIMQQLSTLDSECGIGVNRGNGRENIRHNWTGEYHKAQREKC